MLLSWPSTARLVRGQILQIRGESYVGASRLLGARTGYLVLRHMIPNTIGVILMVVGAVGLLLSLMFWGSWGGFGGYSRRRTTYVDDAPPPGY